MILFDSSEQGFAQRDYVDSAMLHSVGIGLHVEAGLYIQARTCDHLEVNVIGTMSSDLHQIIKKSADDSVSSCTE